MKMFRYLILTIFLFLGIKNVYAVPRFDNTIKVYDYAQVLTEKEEDKLIKKANNYIDKYKIDMVIVTVKYYTQSNTNEYLKTFYNQNGFGTGIYKDGIMIVLDLKEDNVGINTFGKASDYYSELELKNIVNNIKEEDNYYNKLNEFISYSTRYIDEVESIDDITNNNFSIIYFIWMLIPSLIVPTIVIVIGILKNNNIKKCDTASYYIVENSVVINKKDDKFVTTNTKKNRINNK